jgi:hypothetical protein
MPDVRYRCLRCGYKETESRCLGEGGHEKAKVSMAKKVGMIKIVWPKPIPRPSGTSKIELALAKPIGVSKKFCFSDVPSSSLGQRDEGGSSVQMPRGQVMKAVGECTAQVLKFASLGDSSPDTHRPSPPEKTAAGDVPMPSVDTPC